MIVTRPRPRHTCPAPFHDSCLREFLLLASASFVYNLVSRDKFFSRFVGATAFLRRWSADSITARHWLCLSGCVRSPKVTRFSAREMRVVVENILDYARTCSVHTVYMIPRRNSVRRKKTQVSYIFDSKFTTPHWSLEMWYY